MSEPSPRVDTAWITSLFQVVRDNPTSTFLSAVGLVLFLIAMLSAKAAIERPTPPRWLQCLLFGSLVAGILFCGVGATTSILSLFDQRLKGFATAQKQATSVLAELHDNKKIEWLIRLIPFDEEKTPELSIHRLAHLGRSDQRYTFVADYTDLRGYTVADAVQRVGGSLNSAEKVSAIIFPLKGRQLYPANARGVLQIVGELQGTESPGVANRTDLDLGRLDQHLQDDLAKIDRPYYWSWTHYGAYYRDYCETAQQFRCGNFTVKTLMGDLSYDWHPLGLSLRSPPKSDPCTHPSEPCDFRRWEEVSKKLEPIAGARVFLIENAAIARLDGRVLIDFERPDKQVIPDLGIEDAEQAR